MSEFLTSYPRTISVIKGLQDFIRKEEIELNQLSLMVKIKRDEIITALISEGFKRVKLENRKPTQIGHGFSKKLVSPWEIHVRLLQMQQGLIAIQAEVEISRRYIESILKKHKIEYQIWHAKMRQYITSVIDNHQITLSAPRVPPIPWRPMAGSVVTLSLIYLAKFLGILQ
jgi:CRISPR/Cas system-associated exonuclease Cas4 (RecB family)